MPTNPMSPPRTGRIATRRTRHPRRVNPFRLGVVAHARGRVPHGSERGMTTAEYAVGTLAACAFGGILYKVLTSPDVVALLTGIVKRALSLPM